MPLSLRMAVLCVVGLAIGGASTASAQTAAAKLRRQGFWFSAGIAYGSLGCESCSSRVDGFSADLAIGGTISPHFLLAGASSGWTKSQNGATLSVGTIDARLRYYPSLTGGFYLTGGVGLGGISAEVVGVGQGSATGLAVILGLGVDIPVSRGASLTPFLSGVSVRNSNTNANYGQLGLAVTLP